MLNTPGYVQRRVASLIKQFNDGVLPLSFEAVGFFETLMMM